MAVPTITNKKRKNSLSNNNTFHVDSKKKKSKKTNVTVKEEFNVEIPSDVSAISASSSEASSSSSAFSSVVLRDKNLPPISSLLLYKPNIAANRFDPFYQSIEPYAQYAFPDSSNCLPAASVKQETGGNATPVMPIIPYYFHHGRFGIEACMHQLEYHRQQQAVKSYAFNRVNNGVNYYYYI